MSAPPFTRLAYLYVGSTDTARDVVYYRDVLGAKVVWDERAFGAHVAAVRLAPDAPLVLLADHRPAPSTMLVWEVADLEDAATELRSRGWLPKGPSFEVPDGPCFEFEDPSGNALVIMESTRPRALEDR